MCGAGKKMSPYEFVGITLEVLHWTRLAFAMISSIAACCR